MKKFYLVNGNTVEPMWFSSSEDALKEARTRNRYDRNANWGVYDENCEAVYSVCVFR